MRSQVCTMKSRTYPQNLLLVTVPTAAVLTHVLRILVIHLPGIAVFTYLPYLLLYLLHAHVLYLPLAVQCVLRTIIHTYCTADVRTCVYVLKQNI